MMKFYRVIMVFSLLLIAMILNAQDRNIGVNEVYPPAMFKENGGRFINVRKLVESGVHTTNAVGDGVADDSDAIIAAMDWVMNRLRASGQPCGWRESWYIYFPNGTYKVSKPLVYSGDPVPDCVPAQASATREGTAGLKLVGQNRDSVIIKLNDNATGFGTGMKKPVVSFSRFDRGTIFNNAPAGFHFRNITIHTGSGNPGAIGLDFYGANTARLDNVKIVGSGEIGLHVRIGSAHGYYSNLVIDGFKYGIYLDGDAESHPAIEYVSLSNHSGSGILLSGISTSLRKVYSTNSVTGLTLQKKGTRFPHAVIVDSKFENGTSLNTGIRIIDGFLFARNVELLGYGTGIKKLDTTVAVTGTTAEYSSGSFKAFSESRVRTGPVKSMNLGVLDYPLITWEGNFNDWANVDDYGAVGDGVTDDMAAIQLAMNSGKKVVYFPKNKYKISGTVSIPAAVKQVQGAGVWIETGGVKFDVNALSADTLLLRDIELASGSVKHTAKRQLFLESTSSAGNVYTSFLTDSGTKVFANNIHGFARLDGTIKYVKAYVRFVNNEKPDHFQINAGISSTLWIFGFKTEKTFSVMKVRDGAKMEVLGGLLNRYGTDVDPDPVGILNDNSDISVIAATNGPDRYWNPMIKDIQGSVTKTWLMNEFPSRGFGTNIVIPLYVSYGF
ncbi:Pectate lyase superfamily protein [Pedobacter sp. ok626]|uniref:glycosyl hydrolase family 28-related protein n=1 Tax=Pedobacter sp. ok626 TaxID=1761882 RepID=UPI00088C6097|nr:glycosyl hydrolase family 28-related protein [Pedobacter sp. ok626]SDJ01414.1 Pectate lyase superfamily protein [Pedobacter sp. ok626]